jgi:hypothetical protein
VKRRTSPVWRGGIRKARVDGIIRAARYGLTYTVTGEDGAKEKVGEESAASIRARATRAARIYEARLIAGYDEEESDDAEAGALLEAETANEIHGLHTIAEQWREANRE